MSIYESLKAKYTDGWKLELQYWEDLERLAQRCRKDFAGFVGVNPDDQVTINDQTLPIVELGKYTDNKFEPCGAKELPRAVRELEIALRLNFFIDVDPPQKVQHIFTFALTGDNGSFKAIDRVDFQNKQFLVPEFTSFFNHLTQSL